MCGRLIFEFIEHGSHSDRHRYARTESPSIATGLDQVQGSFNARTSMALHENLGRLVEKGNIPRDPMTRPTFRDSH